MHKNLNPDNKPRTPNAKPPAEDAQTDDVDVDVTKSKYLRKNRNYFWNAEIFNN